MRPLARCLTMRLTTPLIAALVSTCAACSTPPAQSLPPPMEGVATQTWPSTLKIAPATYMTLGPLRITFGQTTLSHVARALGVGHVSRRGDAGTAIAWLCYKVGSGQTAARMWLVSGEMDGGKYITGVVMHKSHDPAEHSCPAVSQAYAPVRVGGWLHIGTSVDDLQTRLGPPSHRDGRWRMFDYSRTFKLQSCQKATDHNSLDVRVQHAHVTAVRAFSTLTC